MYLFKDIFNSYLLIYVFLFTVQWKCFVSIIFCPTHYSTVLLDVLFIYIYIFIEAKLELIYFMFTFI